MKTLINTDQAPKPIGPYAQATKAGDFVFTAGQIGIDPETGELVAGDVSEQTRQTLVNLQHVLAAAGATWEDVVKANIYVTDLKNFAAVNTVYETFVSKAPPARATVQVAALPKGALVEIDLVAYVGNNKRADAQKKKPVRRSPGKEIPLKAELAKRGLKANFVARAVGTYAQNFYAVLAGQAPARDDWVKPLAKLLGVNQQRARQLLGL